MMRRWLVPQLLALSLAALALLAILFTAGFAMGSETKGAAVSLIVAAASCLGGVTLSLLGWLDKPLQQIATTLGLLANLGIGLVVIIFAVFIRW
jgi:hypothetical protein